MSLGLAVLGLLCGAAEDRPLLAVVDDAHWLDDASASAVAFLTRRLLEENIAVVLAARQIDSNLERLPELQIKPLGDRDARALLEASLPARFDERVLERIVLEARGNPLALLELPRWLTPAQLAGGFGLPAAVPLPAAIEESFTRRLASLPYDALFLDAASRLEAVDPELARETYLEVLGGALGGDVEVIGGAPAVAAAAQAAPPGRVPLRPADVVLDAFATRLTDGYAAAAPIFARERQGFPSARCSPSAGRSRHRGARASAFCA